MQAWYYIFLGIVQGIAEWLPISSDGHLFIAGELLGLKLDLALVVLLHGASLLALIVYFWRDLITLAKGFFKVEPQSVKYVGLLAITTIITIPVALLLDPYIGQFEQMKWVAIFLLITSVFVGASFWSKERGSIGWKSAILLGLVQGTAVMPGLSRSGPMIALALLLGASSKEAFKFTFLAGIPVILGAFIWEFTDMTWNYYYLLGFIVTFFVGLITLKLLNLIVRKNKFYLFAIYTALLALVILFI